MSGKKIIFDWKTGIDTYFPRFYDHLESHEIPTSLWKIIFEYQHELEAKMDGYYATPFDFVHETGALARLEFLGFREIGFRCTEVSLFGFDFKEPIIMSWTQSKSKTFQWQLPHPITIPWPCINFVPL